MQPTPTQPEQTPFEKALKLTAHIADPYRRAKMIERLEQHLICLQMIKQNHDTQERYRQ